MKKIACATALLGMALLGIGCEKSVQNEQRDVGKAQQKAAEDVQKQEQDLEKAKQKAAEDVAEKKEDVRAAEQKGAEKIQKEEHDVIQKEQKESDAGAIKQKLDETPAANP